MNWRITMPIPNSYTRELEDLILNKLLPVYEDWCKQNRKPTGIPKEILDSLNKKSKVAALLSKPIKQNDTT